MLFCLSYYQHPKRFVLRCQNAYYQQKTDGFIADNESYLRVLGSSKVFLSLYHEAKTSRISGYTLCYASGTEDEHAVAIEPEEWHTMTTVSMFCSGRESTRRQLPE